MKKILASVFLFILGVAAYVWYPRDATPLSPLAIATVLPAPSVIPPTIVERPTTLIIPKLGVETSVEEVGMAPDGRMGVPSSALTVGWWEPGTPPGEEGSAVLAGHYDAPDGSEGVFYHLSSLVVGDEIMIEDSDGESLTFVVTEQATYPDATFPMERVFRSSSGRRLNLITCSGSFDTLSKNYDKRLVVFAELADD